MFYHIVRCFTAFVICLYCAGFGFAFGLAIIEFFVRNP